jgi:hypothetical protein
MSLIDKKALMQIPDGELKAMPTRKLIEAYLDCRFTRNLFIYSDIESYYEQLFMGFNGARELVERNDVVEELIKYYAEMDPFDSNVSGAGVPIRFQVRFVEYLIGNPQIFKKVTDGQLRALLAELMKQVRKKSVSPSADDNLESSIYAIAQVLRSPSGGKELELAQIENSDFLLRTGRIPDERLAERVFDLARRVVGN